MKKMVCLLMTLLMLTGFAFAETTQQPTDLLTESVLDGKLVIEGVFYQMPIPVQQLFDDGWTFERSDRELEPEHFTAAVFTKDNVAFYAQIINEHKTTKQASECHVVTMHFGPKANGTENYDPITVQFSTQIDMNTSKRDLEKLLGEPSSTAGGYPVWRGEGSKYINPGLAFGGVFDDGLFSSKLKYFIVEYLPADFTVEAE